MKVKIQKKIKRQRKGKSKISFDEEVVTKDFAKQLFSEEIEDKKQTEGVGTHDKQKVKRKRNREMTEHNENTKETKINKKKPKLINNPTDISNNETQLQTEGSDKSEVPKETQTDGKKESIRSQKRKKHTKLLEDKKIKVELELQQKALNYISLWKHNRLEWKFEKLRQVWLQQNLFDASKIPSDFWDTTVQYFSGAKGQSRQTVLDQAIKYIEDEEKSLEKSADEDYQIRVKRARDIVQNLE